MRKLKYIKFFENYLISEEIESNDYYNKLGDLLNQKLPKVKPGLIRLWRGNRPGEEKKNPSYTSSLTGIALPFYYGYHEKEQDAVLTYIDIPNEDIEKYIVPGGVKGEEMILPKELLNSVQIVNKDIYKGFEDENLSKTDIEVGGTKGFDDFADKFMKF